MIGRRIQDWTNQNLFENSFDSDSFISYQNQGNNQQKNHLQNIDEGSTENLKKECNDIINIDEEGLEKGTITALQAIWNVTNAIQGMFIVGLPFAVKVGGWFAVFALIGVSYICYRTGLSLIDCLYETETKLDTNNQTIEILATSSNNKTTTKNVIKLRNSYREIADAVRPGLGKFVLAAQLTELTSTCILYLVLIGDLLQGCMPSVDRSAWMMLVTSILLGTAFLTDIRIVSDLSFANAISHFIINLIIVLYCFSQISNWKFSSVVIIPNFRLLPTVIGVVVFGYTSHIFLPSLEASMKDPSKFKWMLSQSHLAAALFKAIFGLIGFLTFAEFTQKEISNSLPNQTFKIVVNLILVLKALFSYPLPYYAIVQLLIQNFFRGTKNTMFSSCFGANRSIRDWAMCLRLILILWTLMMALSVPYLIELMGLIGNITGTVLSFIWPAYFHLKLKGTTLSEPERRFNKFVIGLGITLCVVGVYYSAMELHNAVNTENVVY